MLTCTHMVCGLPGREAWTEANNNMRQTPNRRSTMRAVSELEKINISSCSLHNSAALLLTALHMKMTHFSGATEHLVPHRCRGFFFAKGRPHSSGARKPDGTCWLKASKLGQVSAMWLWGGIWVFIKPLLLTQTTVTSVEAPSVFSLE